MKMFKSLMLGVAVTAMPATGAMAADVLPVVVATTPAPTPVASGPEVAIDVFAFVGFWSGYQIYGDVWGTVDVTSASGWGVRFDGYSYTYLIPGLSGYVDGTTTLYRTFGDFEAGIWAGGGFSWPCCGGGYGVGASLNYERDTGTVYIVSENGIRVLPSFDFYSFTQMEYNPSDRLNISAYLNIYSLSDWEAAAGVAYDLTDRIEVWGNLYVDDAGFDFLEFGAEFSITEKFRVWSWIGFDDPFQFDYFEIGTTFDVTEYLAIWTELDFDGAPFALDYAEAWLELDRQIGTGPLSLLGEFGVGWSGGLYGWGNIGVRYKLGGEEDREDTRLLYY